MSPTSPNDNDSLRVSPHAQREVWGSARLNQADVRSNTCAADRPEPANASLGAIEFSPLRTGWGDARLKNLARLREATRPWILVANQRLGRRRITAAALIGLQLCVGLAITLLLLLRPGFPVAAPNALAAAATATLEAAIGLLLMRVLLLNFDSEGRWLDLFAGLGFGALALVSLSVRVLGLITGLALARPGTSTLLVLVGQGMAIGLFLAGLLGAGRTVGSAHRRGAMWRTAALLTVAAAFGAAIVVGSGAEPRSVIDPHAAAQLANGAAVDAILPGEQPRLMLLDGGFALLMLAAAIGYARAWRQLASPDVGLVAATLSVLALSQLHTLWFPPVTMQYVSTSDGLRLSAYVGATIGLLLRWRTQTAEHARREEQLRLSRELHDGLAQQLSLLQLRLARAAATDRPAEARLRDLEIAQRLTELALVEARQAVAVLRSGSLSWGVFLASITRFADEFATNHDIEVRLESEGAMQQADSDLQREVVHILQEAFSNAIRHGDASRVTVRLVAQDGWCGLTVRDNGRGFDLAGRLTGVGVGLDSMVERLQRRHGKLSIDSAPGCGATLQAWLPSSDAPNPLAQ